MTPKLPLADCDNCPGRNARMVPPEPAVGKAHLAIIGEQPGSAELERGRPFVGASGRLLMKGMRHLGLARSDVHWTNAVPCKVGPKEFTAARKCCAARLTAELAESRAPIVMPVGSHGLKSVLGVRSAPILKYRGTITRQAIDGDQRLICPTIHPAFALRMPQWMPILELDVNRIKRVMRDGWRPPEELPNEHGNPRTFRFPRTADAVAECLARLRTEDVSFDVETVGLGATSTLLVCFVISDGTDSIVVPWSRGANGIRPWWRDPQGMAELISGALEPRITVTHNGYIFDHIIANRYGIRLGRCEDTLQASHSFESHLPRGLDRVASTWLDIGPWKQVPHTEKLTQLWRYCAQDGLYTILTWRAMKGKVT